MKRYVNLVLQGGGVRGIAYVGALKSLPPEIELHTVAGTSAGSIVAALLALGKNPTDIEAIMRRLDLASLLDSEETRRLARIRAVFKPAGEAGNKMWEIPRVALRILLQLHTLLSDVRYIKESRGIHRSDGLKHWLDEIFGDRTFQDISVQELYIVASDVSEKEFVVYSKESHPRTRLSEAVLASASIPIFFRPVVDVDRILVDGGMLSNFPCHLFERTQYPTVGLRLTSAKETKGLLTMVGFVRGLIATMLDAHDKGRVPQAHFRQYSIDTADISATDFDLSDQQKDFLLASGQRTGDCVPWELCASAHPVLKFQDHRPYDVLSWSLEQAAAIATASEEKSAWCDEIDETLVMDYFFEEKWGARLILNYSYVVRGKAALGARRFGLTTPPEGQGMMDMLPEVSSHPAAPDFNVHLLPWAVNNERKGFVVLMIPPITEAAGRRGFTIRLAIKNDHREKLMAQGRDEFPLLSRSRARRHNFTAVAQFWSSRKLGPPIAVRCPSSWEAIKVPDSSPYDEQYESSGAFSVQLDLRGDVRHLFEFKRAETSFLEQ
jgi:NTE family protein